MKIFSPILKGTTTVAQGTTNLSGSFTGSLLGTAATASYADNFTVGGTLTAQTINVQVITSSIEFNTGSTRNGALSTNTHQFTGSVLMTGSLNVNKGVITLPDSIHTSAQINFKNVTTEFELMRFPAANNTMTLYGATDKIYWKTDKSVSNQNILAMTTDGNVGIGTSSPGSPLTFYQSAYNKTTLGDARVIRLENSDPTVQLNSRQEIGFGYSTAYQPVVIGHQITNNTDFTNGSFYIAVRSGVTNSAPTQVLTVTSAGNVGIGTTSPTAILDVDGAASSTIPTLGLRQSSGATAYGQIAVKDDRFHGLILRGIPASTANLSVTAGDQMSFYEYGADFRFYKKQDAVLTLQVRFNEGTIYASNTTVQSISDIRTKENITNSEQGLNVINALRPVRFDFKEEFNQGKKNQLGFIAQEVEEIFSDAVGEWKDDNDGITYKTVGPGALIPVLVKAIQELSAKNTSLEERLTALENN